MIVDTIAAIATPPGTGGGIGIIRISGPGAVAAAHACFSGSAEPDALSKVGSFFSTSIESRAFSSHSIESHRALHGYIVDPETRQVIDEVLLLPMLAPHSYTAEDVVEIQAHSGPVVLRSILTLILSQGVRLADPGEFTKRAFLNGRIDLTQAEAVMDIIEARSAEALKIAVAQGVGRLKDEIKAARESLVTLLTHIEAGIDFPEETGNLLSDGDAVNVVAQVLETCRNAIRRYEDAGFLREGLKLAICGPPNVGKSSLMNRLLEKDRSIVTDIPGTTRDLIEEPLNMNGIPFVISDTAGMHQTEDPVEKIGIERAKTHIEAADLILFVKDAADALHPDEIFSFVPSDKKVIGVLNKIDRLNEGEIAALPKALPSLSSHSDSSNTPISPRCIKAPKETYDVGRGEHGDDSCPIPVISISAKYGDGLDALKKAIMDLSVGDLNLTSSVVPNARHKQALERAVESLEAAEMGLQAALVEETLAIDIENGVEALGEITGDTAGVDLLDRIFSSFCIGK